MKQQKIQGYILDDKYVIIDKVMYRLEKLDTDEMVEAITNGGDALPLVQK